MRPTVWRRLMSRDMMIGVVSVTIGVPGVVIPFHRLRRAEYHSARALILSQEATGGELMCMTPLNPEATYIEAVANAYGPEAGEKQRRAFAHRRLAGAYLQAVYRPWLPGPTEPPDNP